MIVPLSELEKIFNRKLDPQKIEKTLTKIGFEVESVTHSNLSQIDPMVIAAKILTIDPHPNADKLTICTVDTGENLLQVVCGAQNIKINDLVPLAQIGSQLNNLDKSLDSIKIKKTKIRGLESHGMLCSLDELSVGYSEKDKIFILPPKTKIGTKINNLSQLEDFIFNISVAPNRGDCLSFIGIARELAAVLNINFTDKLLNTKTKHYKLTDDIDGISVHINTKDAIRYSLIKIENIFIQESPFWLRNLLAKLNINTVNNIVDSTNLFMFLTGHPIHAFDFDEIIGNRIHISKKVKDTFETLDDNLKNSEGHITISDSKGPIAFAGVIGGKRSCINKKTKNILLECASFNPTTIRLSSKSLNISTESSFRFERRVSEHLIPNALIYAAHLITTICGGTIVKKYIDTNPRIKDSRFITLDLSKVSNTLGLSLKKNKIIQTLSALSIDCISNKDDFYKFNLPPYRFDLLNDCDLIEEIARIIGLDSIPPVLPRIPLREKIFNPTIDLRNIATKAREVFPLEGFAEVINFSFTNDRTSFPKLKKFEILNPHSQDAKFLRTSLIPSLIQNALYNFNHHLEAFKLFEIGNIFIDDNSGTSQRMQIGIICSYKSSDPFWKKSQDDFFDLKNSLFKFFQSLGLDIKQIVFKSELSKIYNDILHPAKSSMIYFNKYLIGYIGELHPEVSRQYEIKKGLVLSTIFVDKIPNFINPKKIMRPFGNFPFIQRDLSIVVDKDIQSQKILETISSFPSPIIKDTFVFDLFEDSKLGKNKKSLSLSVVFGSDDRTLQDDEVSSIFEQLVINLQKEINAEIRE